MGNWRTVRMVGTCAPAEVAALREAVTEYQRKHRRDWDGINFDLVTPLSASSGIFGLGDWSGETIAAHGNLFERDYTPESVAAALMTYAKIAPSLAMKVHCGGDYEDTKCVATVNLTHGVATVDPPEVADVGTFDDDDTTTRIFRALTQA